MKKSEAFAKDILKQGLSAKQPITSSQLQQHISTERERIIKHSQIGQLRALDFADLEDDQELPELSPIRESKIEPKTVQQKDQVFFNFMGIYTADSFKQTK